MCGSVSFEEFVGTDAAADELKAMRLCKGMKLRRVRVRVRDGAHAAGRLGLAMHVEADFRCKSCFILL